MKFVRASRAISRWINSREGSGYGCTAVTQAMFDLQDEGKYEVYRKDGRGVLCIERVNRDSAHANRPVKRCTPSRTLYYLRMSAIAALSAFASIMQSHMTEWRHWPVIGVSAAWALGWVMALVNRYWAPLPQQ